MSNLNSFIISFCGACVLLGGIYMLCPQSSLLKSIKYVYCLVFLCALLSCFSNINKIEFEIPQSDKSYTITEDTAEITAQLVFEQVLKDNSINFSNIKVYTNKSQSGDIFISKVDIYSSDSPEKIIELLKGAGEYEVNIIDNSKN